MLTHLIQQYTQYINELASGNQFLATSLFIGIPTIAILLVTRLKGIVQALRDRMYATITIDTVSLGTSYYYHATDVLESLDNHLPGFIDTTGGFSKPIRGCDLHSYLVTRTNPQEIERHRPPPQAFKHTEANVINLAKCD